ncbi:eukaryotic translation initiation factor 2-alpha kinase 3 [Caerostris darwini]|uniref:non-specific serine/threonine protein kinase n=1 Tax=Caerostris darwini TaxID=1538125 RepID=A0AAV4XBB1_9ARAC|nr:eukaryotic translation initiation factor 2-alpha kinase 3 [Caerostris darwini]
MEVANKTDNKKYAVKRIRIENNVYTSVGYTRSMREVKAVIKLHHPNIVQYFHAWLESPPEGLQKFIDGVSHISSLSTTVSSSTSTTSSNMPQVNQEGDSLEDLSMRKLKEKLSYSNTFEEYISSPDDENFTNANKNVISNLGTLKVSPSSKKLKMKPLNPFSDNLDDPNYTSQPSSYSDSFEEYTSSFTGACNVEKTDFGNFKSISEVSVCYDESDEPPNDVDFLPENSKCLFVKQTVHGNAIDNSNEFMRSLLNTNDIKNVRSMLKIPEDMFIDEPATFLHLKIINNNLSCRMNSIFLNKLYPYIFSEASLPDKDYPEWTGWTCILDDIEVHKISSHLFYFRNWLASVLCAVRKICSCYHTLLFSNISKILCEVNHLLVDDCATKLPGESSAIRIGIFFCVRKWNSILSTPMKFPYLVKLRHFLFCHLHSLNSNQCTLNLRYIFYRSDIIIFQNNLNLFQIWITSIMGQIRTADNEVFNNLLTNLSTILDEANSISIDETFELMSPEKFLSMFGDLFKFAVDAIYIQEYENTQLLMFHNTPLHEYRTDLVDNDPEFARPRYLYIQMELCRKDNLRTWLKMHCEQRNYSEVMKMFYQIVFAVAYMHKTGLMHRDLKPSNIYFSFNGLIKIGDFGLATQFEIPGVDHSYEYDLFSSHSVKVGTPTYMSPEQGSQKKYNYKTDIFSLGIILFELLVPFSSNSRRLKTIHFARKGKFSEDFIEKYENESLLIKKMLDPNPRRRPTALEILQHPLCLPYR